MKPGEEEEVHVKFEHPWSLRWVLTSKNAICWRSQVGGVCVGRPRRTEEQLSTRLDLGKTDCEPDLVTSFSDSD